MKMQKIKKQWAGLILAILAFTPMLAMAVTDIQTILLNVKSIVRLIVPILITVALIYFIWGVIQYITAGDDEEKRKNSRNVILYGVIGLFAIVAVWGLVEVIMNTFDITQGTIDPPSFNF